MKIQSINLNFKGNSKSPLGIGNYMSAVKSNDKLALNKPFEQPLSPALDNLETDESLNKKPNKNLNKKIVFGGLIALAAVSGAIVLISKGKSNKVKNAAIEAGKEIIDNSKTINSSKTEAIKEIGNKTNTLDFEYKTQFTKGLKEFFGIEKSVEDIKSVMGPEEFESLLKKLDGKDMVVHEDAVSFMERMLKMPCNKKWKEILPADRKEYYEFLNEKMPKEELENYYRPLIDGTCRLFLTSEFDYDDVDSKKAAKTFLDRAVQYANKVAKNVQDDKPAFTIGALNSIDADPKFLQEITKELADNPEKYKNLKVILGLRDGADASGKVYGAGLFVNPFDKTFVDNFNKANEKRISDIKYMFKNIYITPEQEIFYLRILNLPKPLKKYHPNGVPKDWKLLSDNEVEDFFKDPKLKRSRNTATDSYELFKAFYEKYIKKQIAIEPNEPFKKGDEKKIKDFFDEYVEKVTNENPACDGKTFPATYNLGFSPKSSKHIHNVNVYNAELYKPSMFDQFALRSYIKKHSAYGRYEWPRVGAKEAFKPCTSDGKNYDPHGLLSKDEIMKMLDKKNREISLPYDEYKPSKYLFGDRVRITKEVWEKIIQ